MGHDSFIYYNKESNKKFVSDAWAKDQVKGNFCVPVLITVQIGGHNICFDAELTKIIPIYHQILSLM